MVVFPPGPIFGFDYTGSPQRHRENFPALAVSIFSGVPMKPQEETVSRRRVFSMLPAGAAACLGCLGAGGCAGQAKAAEHNWTEKADVTWEEIFRFAFQKEYIPLMKGLAARIGEEKFIAMLKEIVSQRARKGMETRPLPKRDLATWVASMKAMPPLYQHALTAEIVEDTPRAFEYHVTRCLWAKAFREEKAADIGYAVVCYPDYAVANGYNAKLKLTRNKTLIQGHDCCTLRYEMET
jgi:hypothetical protein